MQTETLSRPANTTDLAIEQREQEAQVNAYDWESYRIMVDRAQEEYEYRSGQ